MRRVRRVAVLIVSGAMLASCSRTDDANRQAGTPEAQPAGAVGAGGAGAGLSDAELVRDVALENAAAIELSRMALQRTTNPAVKAFAQKLIDDHAAASDALKRGVSGQPFEWPAQLDEKRRDVRDDLAQTTGGDFDREYVKAMIEAHQTLAAKLESRLDVRSLAAWKTAAAARTDSNALPDPGTSLSDVPLQPREAADGASMAINRWAADTYPVEQQHLDTFRTLDRLGK